LLSAMLLSPLLGLLLLLCLTNLRTMKLEQARHDELMRAMAWGKVTPPPLPLIN
jgi:hypothetical protein